MSTDVSSVEKRIVEGCDDAVVYADREGLIRVWNAAAQRLFGYPAGEALGQTLDLIIPPKHRARHWEGYARVVATGQTAYAGSLLAVPAVTRDGSRVSVEFSVTLVCDDTGRVEGMAAILRDVTERRAAQRARERELAELRDRVATVDEAAEPPSSQ